MAHIDPVIPDFQYSVHRIGIVIIIIALHGNKTIDIELIWMKDGISAMQKTVFSRILVSQIFQPWRFAMRIAAYNQFFRFHRLQYSMISSSFFCRNVWCVKIYAGETHEQYCKSDQLHPVWWDDHHHSWHDCLCSAASSYTFDLFIKDERIHRSDEKENAADEH